MSDEENNGKQNDDFVMKYYDKLKIHKINEENLEKYDTKKAFKFANDCRDKEIDRFWSRGLYFWGFILASFSAYIAVLNSSLKEPKVINFVNLCEMSFTAKFCLFILSFVCLFFCLSWQLVHKGSKFWQVNWEKHISYLEEAYIGKIYKTYLDTSKNDFKANPFSIKPYDYSVSKISLFCSILLTLVSSLLFVFNTILLFIPSGCNFFISDCWCNMKVIGKYIVSGFFLLFIIVFFICFFINVRGNKSKKKESKEKSDDEKIFFVQKNLSDIVLTEYNDKKQN